VERGEGIVSLRLLTDAISKVQRGTDRMAAELAVVRLPKEIDKQRSELNAMGVKIGALEFEIARASSSHGNRKSSLTAAHVFSAIGAGIAGGLILGFVVNLLLPTSVAGYSGLIAAVIYGIGYFRNPRRAFRRLEAAMEDQWDEVSRQSAPRNTEELQTVRQARAAMEDRLEELNGKLAAARAIVATARRCYAPNTANAASSVPTPR